MAMMMMPLTNAVEISSSEFRRQTSGYDYFTRLPLEIRQKVYSYLLNDQVLQIIPKLVRCGFAKEPMNPAYFYYKFRLTKVIQTSFLFPISSARGSLSVNVPKAMFTTNEAPYPLYRLWNQMGLNRGDGPNLSLVSRQIYEEVSDSKLRSDLYIQVIGDGEIGLYNKDKLTLGRISSVLFCPGPEINHDQSSTLVLLPNLKFVSFSAVKLCIQKPLANFSLKAYLAGILSGEPDAYKVLLTLGLPLFPERPQFFGRDGTILARQLILIDHGEKRGDTCSGLNIVFAQKISDSETRLENLHIIHCDSIFEKSHDCSRVPSAVWKHTELKQYTLNIDVTDRQRLLCEQLRDRQSDSTSASEIIDQLRTEWQKCAAVACLGSAVYGRMAIWAKNRVGFCIENFPERLLMEGDQAVDDGKYRFYNNCY